MLLCAMSVSPAQIVSAQAGSNSPVITKQRFVFLVDQSSHMTREDTDEGNRRFTSVAAIVRHLADLQQHIFKDAGIAIEVSIIFFGQEAQAVEFQVGSTQQRWLPLVREMMDASQLEDYVEQAIEAARLAQCSDCDTASNFSAALNKVLELTGGAATDGAERTALIWLTDGVSWCRVGQRTNNGEDCSQFVGGVGGPQTRPAMQAFKDQFDQLRQDGFLPRSSVQTYVLGLNPNTWAWPGGHRDLWRQIADDVRNFDSENRLEQKLEPTLMGIVNRQLIESACEAPVNPQATAIACPVQYVHVNSQEARRFHVPPRQQTMIVRSSSGYASHLRLQPDNTPGQDPQYNTPSDPIEYPQTGTWAVQPAQGGPSNNLLGNDLMFFRLTPAPPPNIAFRETEIQPFQYERIGIDIDLGLSVESNRTVPATTQIELTSCVVLSDTECELEETIILKRPNAAAQPHNDVFIVPERGFLPYRITLQARYNGEGSEPVILDHIQTDPIQPLLLQLDCEPYTQRDELQSTEATRVIALFPNQDDAARWGLDLSTPGNAIRPLPANLLDRLGLSVEVIQSSGESRHTKSIEDYTQEDATSSNLLRFGNKSLYQEIRANSAQTDVTVNFLSVLRRYDREPEILSNMFEENVSGCLFRQRSISLAGLTINRSEDRLQIEIRFRDDRLANLVQSLNQSTNQDRLRLRWRILDQAGTTEIDDGETNFSSIYNSMDSIDTVFVISVPILPPTFYLLDMSIMWRDGDVDREIYQGNQAFNADQ